jgi:hypothetical protein
MSSWALLLALSGFQYDGVSQKICFSPRINQENFATFWSTGSAWGSCGLDLEGAIIQVAGGELTIQEIDFSGWYPWEKLHSCQLAGRKIKVRYIKAPHSSQLHRLIFDSPLRIKKGETLKIKAQ